MSPRDISVIFRSLYSSSYLFETYSEQALELLTQTTFTNGIVRGVEKDVIVAHKFGEHTMYYEQPEKPPLHQLHDCGIVYYPEKPYLICVMTEGSNIANLENTIQTISSKTYSFVKNRF